MANIAVIYIDQNTFHFYDIDNKKFIVKLSSQSVNYIIQILKNYIDFDENDVINKIKNEKLFYKDILGL
jgi:hypothetical protein